MHASPMVRQPQVRVLVIDDDHDVADSTAAVLRLLDYDVCVAYSGDEAVAVAGQYRPDVVVLDIDMPGMDGLQTARHLKRDRRLARKSFVAHTASDEPFVRHVASQIGFRDLVVKGQPLSALIDVLLDETSGRPAARSTVLSKAPD
jgi:CheY-like chemotaxis protein